MGEEYAMTSSRGGGEISSLEESLEALSLDMGAPGASLCLTITYELQEIARWEVPRLSPFWTRSSSPPTKAGTE